MAEGLEVFSSFVFDEEKELTLTILEKHLGRSVGLLQGGTEEDQIYRVKSITSDGDKDNASAELLKEFHVYSKNQYSSILSVDKLQQYMIGMCDRRSQARNDKERYKKLGNVMFILSFAPMVGQIRHIDSTDPNLQVCLYMSADCPSTIVYSLDDNDGSEQITNTHELIKYWEVCNQEVPSLVKEILLGIANFPLKNKYCTKYFSFWETVDHHLNSFGKLYFPVSRVLQIEDTQPGTTLIAGGNQVHAGPPTTSPRMFAFAIAIPEKDESAEDIDGEVQYHPALLHLDLCSIIFSLMDDDNVSTVDDARRQKDGKRFLIRMFPAFIREYPSEKYSELIGDDRGEVRGWLGMLVESANDALKVEQLIEEAVESQTMFCTPDVVKRLEKKRRKQKQKKQK